MKELPLLPEYTEIEPNYQEIDPNEDSTLELLIKIEQIPESDQNPKLIENMEIENLNEKYMQEEFERQKEREQEELQKLLRDRIP